MLHQFIERETSRIKTEKLYYDRIVNYIYNNSRERPGYLYKIVTSSRMSSLLAYINYDFPLGSRLTGGNKFVKKIGIDLSECVDPLKKLNSARKIFERKIRYWDFRPMTGDSAEIVSPADSRMIAGSFKDTSIIFLKEKFFSYEEFIGPEKREWLSAFHGGDFAVFRLTPDKYHYNHVPVSGKVVDIYEISGKYNSCNPGAVISVVTPFSKNKRTVTVIDTDVENGSRIGLVAMIEVVALMIGHIRQCYSEIKYDNPAPLMPGMFLMKGQPKSLYRPGSSVDILIFQKDRIRFSDDIIRNLKKPGAQSRFTDSKGNPLVETDVKVRSTIARKKNKL